MSKDKNAKAAESNTPKDEATKDDIHQADKALVEEAKAEDAKDTAAEEADKAIASTELPVKDVTDPETQAREDREDLDSDFETAEAEEAGDKTVAGAYEGPAPDGSVRNKEGRVAYAPPGSMNAAMAGVQQDAAGHADSVGTDNSPKSGTRV